MDTSAEFLALIKSMGNRPAEGTDRAPAKGTSEEVLVQYTVCCTVGVHCVPVSPITHHQPYAYRAALAIALRSWRRSKFQSPLSLAVRFVIRGQLDSGRKFRFCSLGSCLVGARCSDCSSPPTGLLSCTITFTLYGCDQGQASTSPQMHKSMRQGPLRCVHISVPSPTSTLAVFPGYGLTMCSSSAGPAVVCRVSCGDVVCVRRGFRLGRRDAGRREAAARGTAAAATCRAGELWAQPPPETSVR